MSTSGNTYSIRMIKITEWEDAMALCRSVFLEFESPLYEQEGTDNFIRFIED